MKSDLDGLAAREAEGRTKNARTRDPRFIKFLEHLAFGQSISGACGSSDLPRRTLYDWMEQDQEIRDMVDHAKCKGLSVLELEMRQSSRGGDGDWRGSSWLMSRLHPDDYGEKRELTVTTNEGAQKQLEMVSAMIEQTSEIITDDDDSGRKSEK